MIRLAIAAPDLDEYQTLGFDGAIVVGRAEQCDLVLRSRGVSSSHCRLTMVPGLGGAYMLEDLRSTYGTMVNGQPVTKPVVVSDRDVIAVGGHCFLIVGSGGDAAAYARLQEYRVALSVGATPSAPVAPVPAPVAQGNVATVPQFGVDASWAEKYAHFDKLTRAWHEAGRPRRGLLRGEAIRVGEAWLAAGLHKRPAPEAVHQEFIVRSRRVRSSGLTRVVAVIVGGALALGLAGLGVHYRDELREALWADPPGTLPATPDETNTTPEGPTNQVGGLDIEALANKSLTVTDPNVRLVLQAGIAGEIIGQRAPLSSGPGWDLFTATQQALATMNATPFVGHTQAITAVAIGPTGRWMVSGSADNSARLYDLSGPAPVVASIFRGHWGPVSAIAFSPDGTMLITASEDNAVRRWDLTAKDPAATARVLRRHDSEVSHLAWHPGGKFLISADVGGTLVAWDMRALDPQTTATSHVAHTAPITALQFSGERLYTASDDRLARRFTLSPEGKLKRSLRFEAHLGGVASLTVSSDGRFVATGGTDGEVYLWDQDSKSPGRFAAALLGHNQAVNALVFTPDVGQLVTASDDDTLRVWNVKAKDPSVGSVVLPGHTGDITSVHIAADGTKAVTTGLDNSIRVWDLAKSDRVVDQYPLVGHQGPITAFAVSPDRLWAVSGSSDATVRVWDLLSRTPGRGGKLLRLGAGPVYDAAMSRLGDRVVAVGVNGGVALWDLQQPAVSPRPTRLRGLKDLVNATAYDPQGRYIATGSDSGEVTLWPITQADPSAQRRTLGAPDQQHKGPVNALAFTPGGERLLSVSSDRTVIAWAIDSEAPPELWRGHRDEVHTLAMSPSGDFAFSAGLDGAILRWPLADGQRGTAAELRGHEGEVLKLRVSSDGKLLASASADRRARLWDAATGSPTLVFRGHDEPVSAVAFGPKQAFATAGQDGKILVWDLGSERPSESPQALLGHEQTVNDLTFVGETDLLVSASNDATIRVWQLSTGASTTLVGNDRPVTRVMVDPRGRMLLSTGYDGTVRMWPLDPEVLRWLVCDAVGRPVDVTTWDTFFAGSPPQRVCAP